MTHLSTTQNRHKRYLPAVKPIAGLFAKAGYLHRKWQLITKIRSERRTLSHLSDHQLRDIGLTRDQVNHEVSRSIFDIPPRDSEVFFLQGGSGEPRGSGIKRLPEER